MMLNGGNRKLHEYFEKFNIKKTATEIFYQTKESFSYREKLKEIVCFNILDNTLSGSPNVSRNVSRKNLTVEDDNSLNEIRKISNGNINQNLSISAVFGDGPLGMTLSETAEGNAYVSKVIKGGNAERNGILIGDLVCKVEGTSVTNFDEIMDSIPFIQRPLHIDFNRNIVEYMEF